MAELALGLYAAYLGLAFVARSVIQYRRTGSTGFKSIGGRPGSMEWSGGVTDGPFGLVRSPIFSAMLPTSLGLVLLVPNAVALAGLIALVVALEMQTRWVEEPYLLGAHGDGYERHAARVGRFVPGLGRLR